MHLSGKQDLFEAYLKRIGKKTGGLADYASAGGKNIKSALSIQGTKSYMPTLPVVTGGQPPVLSAEPLRFEKVNKEPEQAEPETRQPQMLTIEPEREGRGLRPEAYQVREQRGLRPEAYQPKEETILPAATRSLADIQAEIDKLEAEAKKVRYKQAGNEIIRKLEKLKEEYYYTKNAEAWEKLSDADRALMLAAAEESTQTAAGQMAQLLANLDPSSAGYVNLDVSGQTPAVDAAREHFGDEEFPALLEYAKRVRNAETQAQRSEEVSAWAEENPGKAFFAQAGANLGTGLANLDVLANRFQNLGAEATGYVPLDTNSPMWSAAHATSDLVSGGVQAVEERNEGKFLGKELDILGGQEIGSFLYQTGASGLNSIVNLGVAALTGGIAGLSGKAVSTLSSIAMGNQTVANTILSNKEQGMTDSDAVSLGIIAGAVEALTEKYSLDTLLSADATKLAGMVNKIIKNPAANSVVKAFIAEGSEETASYLLNAVADVLVRGDENDIRAEYDRYIDAGMTKGEALGRTVLGILGETSSNFLGGALTGLVMGGGKAAVDAVARKSETTSKAKNAVTEAPASAPQMPVNAAENAAVSNVGEAVKDVGNAAPTADFKTETGNYAASNVDPESVSAKKAAYQYTEAESKQKSTAEVLEDLTDKELAELDTAYPQQADTHQRISVKQNDEIARQRVEIDMAGEKEDLAKKDSWNAEDVATAQAILVKQRDMWRSAPEGDARQNARDAFNAWYDVVLEHKTTTAQAMRQMQEYVLQTAADDPAIAETLIRKELEKVNRKGKSEFGDKWKRIELTADETANLAALQPGDQDGLNALIDKIGKRIQKEYPAKVWEKVAEFSTVSMLLNTRTLIKNPLSNLLLAGVSRTSDRVSALAQAAIHAFDKDFEATQAFVISKKSRELAKEVWKNVGEVVAEQGQRYDRNKTENKISLLNYANKKEVFKKSGKLPMLGNFVGKTYGAIGTGLNKLSARIVGAELFTEMSAEKSALENTRQLLYGLLELGDRGFMRASFVSRLASYIEAKGITDIDNIPDEAYRLAIESAFMDTFKDDNRISAMMVEMKHALNKVGAGELLMKFVKTPANVTARTIDYSPAGLLYNTARAISVGRKAKKSGDINNAAELSRMVDMASKGLTGSALVGLGIILAATGRITGGWPDDEDEAAFLQQAGWRPFSFVTNNGKYISFDWAQPVAMALVLGASLFENWNSGNGKGLLETMKDLAVTYFDTIFEQSTLQEFENLFGGYGSTGDNILDVMLNYPLRFISSGAYAATKATDNINRETYVKGGMEASIQTLINKMYAKIPELSKKLPAKYDVWGNVSKRDETYGEAFFNAYFNPGTTTQYKDTAVNNEILRLYDATKNKAVFPMKPDRNATVKRNGKNETVALDNEQYSQISKETGTAAKALMEAAMRSPYYKGLSDEKKVDFLSDMWSLSKVVGKVNVLGNESTIITGAIENKEYEVYAKNGAAGVMRYYETKKDADTNQNGHVSQEELLIYLDGKNWSSAEKGNWLSTFVSGKESAPAAVVNKYGEKALASWYDYYSVLYNDALAYNEKRGNKDVSLGALRQRDLAKETLDGMKISDEQRAYYWDLISKEDSWQKRNPYD